MLENIVNFFRSLGKNKSESKSKDAAKERLHLVLMQDRANISADFLALMKQEIIEVIKKYIDVDENAIDVRLTNKSNDDGTTGAPVLYANIPIVSVKEEAKEQARKAGADISSQPKQEEQKETKKNQNEMKQDKKIVQENDKQAEEKKETIKKEELQKKEEIKSEEEEKTNEVIEKAEEIVEEIKEEVEKESVNN